MPLPSGGLLYLLPELRELVLEIGHGPGQKKLYCLDLLQSLLQVLVEPGLMPLEPVRQLLQRLFLDLDAFVQIGPSLCRP